MKSLFLILTLLFTLPAFCQSQFQNETAGSISYTSGHVMELAQEIPADKYSWSPDKGVRSVAQVFAHIISANYFFASKLGAKVPADLNMQTLETDLKSKEAIVAELKRSYDLAITLLKIRRMHR